MTFREEWRIIENEYLSDQWKKEREALKQKLVSKQIVLYGVGFFGGVIVKNFAAQGILVECFCDSNKSGVDSETNLRIISPKELKEKYTEANIVISVANPSTENTIYKMLLEMKFNKNQVFRFKDAYQFMKKSRVEQVTLEMDELQEHLDGYERMYNFFSDDRSREIILETIRSYLFNQLFTYEPPKESYFPEQFNFGENEVFIDGGLYTGDTAEEFINRVDGKYFQIIGFDIDEDNLVEAHKNLDSASKVKIIEKGLWDCTVSKPAELGIKAGSNVKDEGEDIIELVSLDEVFANIPLKEYPTFIKLDIEGSEKEALRGAEKIIRNVAPKLAVCVYHRPEDIYVLTELIQSFNSNYKFFLRHYSPYIWDTVLYAYKEESLCRNR